VNLIPELGKNMPKLSDGLAITLALNCRARGENSIANTDARKRSVDVQPSTVEVYISIVPVVGTIEKER
jgi:hypothetical protein